MKSSEFIEKIRAGGFTEQEARKLNNKALGLIEKEEKVLATAVKAEEAGQEDEAKRALEEAMSLSIQETNLSAIELEDLQKFEKEEWFYPEYDIKHHEIKEAQVDKYVLEMNKEIEGLVESAKKIIRLKNYYEQYAHNLFGRLGMQPNIAQQLKEEREKCIKAARALAKQQEEFSQRESFLEKELGKLEARREVLEEHRGAKKSQAETQIGQDTEIMIKRAQAIKQAAKTASPKVQQQVAMDVEAIDEAMFALNKFLSEGRTDAAQKKLNDVRAVIGRLERVAPKTPIGKEALSLEEIREQLGKMIARYETIA